MALKGTVRDAINTGHGSTTQSGHFLYLPVTALLIKNNQGPYLENKMRTFTTMTRKEI
jgi:hypothetical protein